MLRILSLFLSCLGLLSLVHGAPAEAQLRATKISATNAAALISGGPDAIGGIDDWFFTNGTLCAVVSDVAHESEFSTNGGVLVDLGFCGREDDHYSFNQDMLDGSRSRPLNVSRVELVSESNLVGVDTYAYADGAELVTRYRLDTIDPTQLKISKTLRVIDESKPGFNLHASVAFNVRSLEPFVFSSTDYSQSTGFRHQDFVSRGIKAIPDASHFADTIVLLSPPDADYPISYGWQLRSAIRRDTGGENTALPHFALADEESIAMLIATDDFYIGDGSKMGFLQLLQTKLMSLDVGDVLELEERIYVGAKSEVSAITDQMLTDQVSDRSVLVSGSSNVADSVVHVDLVDGTPFTHVRVKADGSFSFRAPPGDYRLRHMASADRISVETFTVGAVDLTINQLSLPPIAVLNLPQGESMRLVFEGINGTTSPNFVDTLTGLSVFDEGGEHFAKRIPQIFLAGIASDRTTAELPAGEYRVYATRGPEYSLEVTNIKVKAGSVSDLLISTPSHQLPTPGYIAADFHVHAGNSLDNSFSNRERVRTFVAEHGEILMATEHDVVADFAPLLSEMGVNDKIKSFNGIEATSLLATDKMRFTGGHINFFPYQYQPYQYRKGAVRHEHRRLREVLYDVSKSNPKAISQLNHARQNLSLSGALPSDHEELIDMGSYLDHMGIAGHPYNPEQSLHSHPNNTLLEADPVTGVRDIDFDAMEIINPSREGHEERIAAVRKDWLSFLRQGLRITGTANSDSHGTGEQVAVPRNMVAVKHDTVANFELEELLAAVKSGNIYGTTGPMLNVELSGVGMGQTFSGSSAMLTIAINSVDWVDVNAIDVSLNGQVVKRFTPKSSSPQEQVFSLAMEFDQDSFVTVEAYGEPSHAYEIVYPGLKPYAFTNPIYVDQDNDGSWIPVNSIYK